ncbi:MAG: helix-turn-helix domain-containing protein [Bacteroidaceae bacterium]|nr:helix-turn-helix domain-containing protein [Bacteroidaceae bacterium]MBR1379906.1 helix-turn-helix domain-containing protein [Bacteroidaceae bacterium]
MKRYTERIVATLVALVFSLTLWPATEFQLQQLTTADGLANNTVRKIMQDSYGRIWAATSNGLSRYDGRKFVNYRAMHDKSHMGLTDQRVMNIYEDNERRLWIYQRTGDVACLDLRTDRFIDFEAQHIAMPGDPEGQPTTWVGDSRGRIWRVTDNDGLYVEDPSTGISEHFTTLSHTNPLPTDALKCIFIDSDGVVWIGTDNLGISQLKVMQNDGVEYMLDGENIRMLLSLANGSIAIGSRNGDVWIYDSTLTTCLETMHHDFNTYYLAISPSGTRWRGTKGDGLYVGNKPAVHYLHTDSVDGTLAHNEIYAIHFDSNGHSWVGTFGGGLCVAEEEGTDGSLSFTTFLDHDYGSRRIRAIVEDSLSHLWIATSHGVYRLNPTLFMADTTQYTHLCTGNSTLQSEEVRTLFRASDGTIYISEAGEGFAIFDTGAHLVRRITEQTDSLVNSMVQCFVEDADGMIWVSTEFGISRYNPFTHRITNYFFSKNMLTNVYSENCGCRLADGRLAFGTNNGVVLIDPQVYNAGERSQLSRSDVTIDGQSPRHDIIYIMRQWWNSPWAVAIYIVVVVAVLVWWLRVRRNTHRYNRLVHTLKTQRESIREQFSTDVALRRKANLDAADSEFVSRIDAIVANHIADSRFTPDHFAAEMSMGRTTFYNNMRRITGYAPREYITRKRIKMAAHLITTTTHTIAEISDRVGIEDPLYLSRLFRKIYGCSPREWRKNASKHTQPDATISSQPVDDILNGR